MCIKKLGGVSFSMQGGPQRGGTEPFAHVNKGEVSPQEGRRPLLFFPWSCVALIVIIVTSATSERSCFMLS